MVDFNQGENKRGRRLKFQIYIWGSIMLDMVRINLWGGENCFPILMTLISHKKWQKLEKQDIFSQLDKLENGSRGQQLLNFTLKSFI